MSSPNDPAYPTDKRVSTAHWGQMTASSTIMRSGGMTIRQQFVMAAMQGLLANRDCCTAAYVLAGLAREFADTALAEEARTRQS